MFPPGIFNPQLEKLTLMNPAYILRQMMSDYEKMYGTKGIITGLKQLNPINKPDAWGENALKALENPEMNEFFEVKTEPEGTFLQLIRPMHTQESCLKCHAIQGYKVGDLGGGIGVRVAMGSYLDLERETLDNIRKMLIIFWLAGMIAIALFTFWGHNRIVNANAMQQQLILSNNNFSKV